MPSWELSAVWAFANLTELIAMSPELLAAAANCVFKATASAFERFNDLPNCIVSLSASPIAFTKAKVYLLYRQHLLDLQWHLQRL